MGVASRTKKENKDAGERIYNAMVWRRKLRQWCFRMQNAELKDLDCDECPFEGYREKIEAFEAFDEWKNFGVTWVIPRIEVGDLQKEGVPQNEILELMEAPIYAEELLFTLEEQWDAEVRQHARAMPRKHTRLQKHKIAQAIAQAAH